MGEYRAPSRTLGTEIARPRRGESRISVLLRRTVTNMPLRVPAVDWAKVVLGEKRMFRAYSASKRDRSLSVVPPSTECPRPCLFFTQHGSGRWEASPGVLLSHRQEPLGAITPEDLVREGFEFLPAFRWYWKKRYPKLGWRPRDMVSVLEVRPWEHGDRMEFAERLLVELFGEWFDEWNGAHHL